jgi:hypothetical protein
VAVLLVALLAVFLEGLLPAQAAIVGWSCFGLWVVLVVGLWLLLIIAGGIEPKPAICDRDITIMQVVFMGIMLAQASTPEGQVRGEGELGVMFMEFIFILMHLLFFSLAWGMRVRLPLKTYLMFAVVLTSSVLWGMHSHA